ncbi:MAG: hypothetical protein AAF628_14635 [Planctomycetota bacterium]
MRFPPLALIAVCTTLAPLPRAQDGAADPLSLIPKQALLVAWADGPAALRDAFAGTRLADMVAGPEITGLLEPILEEFRAGAGASLQGTGVDADALEELVAGYSGRMALGMGLDRDVLEQGGPLGDLEPEDLRLWIAVVAASDGETDFTELSEAILEAVEQQGELELFDADAAGRTLRAAHLRRAQITLPFVHDGHLMLVMAPNLDDALATVLLGQESMADAAIELPEGNLGAWFDGGTFGQLITQAMRDELGDVGDQLATGFGLPALRGLTMTIAPTGPHVALRARIGLDGDDAGFFNLFTAVSDSPPDLLEITPVQRDVWSVTKMNLEALYDVIASIADTLADETGMPSSALEQMFEDNFRVRLREDLVQHFGDELVSVGAGGMPSGDEEDELEAMGAQMNGVFYGIELADAAAFDASFEKLIRSRGLHAARKTEDYRGYKVRRITLLAMPVFYAVTDRLFGLGVGQLGAQELRAVLDETRDRADGKPAPPLPEAVTERLEGVEPGWQGIGASDLVAIAGSFSQGMGEVMRESGVADRDLQMLHTVLSTARQLAQRYDLRTIASVSRVDSNGLLIETIW